MNETQLAESVFQPITPESAPAHWVILISRKAAFNEGGLEHREWLKRYYLDQGELQRLARFRRQEDQDRYLLAHSLKRLCLSRLLNKEPLDCQFMANDKGKPFCVEEGAPDFNLSHSGDWIALAISNKGMVGVDVEASDRAISPAVARYSLNQTQLALAGDDQSRLLAYWTQKEAISKALGKGLSIDFKSVECEGCLGVSTVKHTDHDLRVDLRVESRWVDDKVPYLLSVATEDSEEPQYFCVSEWQKTQLRLQAL